MTLWTFCQSVLLTFNAFAILNEQRFLEKCGLGQSSLTSGYVSATSPRGQLIGLITATQYMRGASSRRSGRSRRRSRARPPRNGCPRFLGTGRPAGRRKERIVSRFLLSVARPRSASSFVAASLTDPRAPPERSPAGRAERAGDLREDGVRVRPSVRLECLSEATLPGAHAVQLAFFSAGKAFCLVCPYSWDQESLESFAKVYRRHPETMRGTAVAVREDTGEVVGVIATATHGQPRAPADEEMHAMKPGECYIEWLAVTAAARGCGVGTKLLRWARRHAEAQNCVELTLGVVNGNPAIRLYEREGFEAVPEDACEAACSCFCVTLFMGCPNGRCGGLKMQMRLSDGNGNAHANETDAPAMSRDA